MDIILLKDMDKLGDKHEVVKVKPGFGRNFLIPQGIGVIANKTNKEKLSALIAEEDAAEAARKEEYVQLANIMAGQTVKLGVKAGTSGKIFGSVTAVQIAQAIKDQLDIEIPRKKIELEEDFKEVGTYTATINLHKEVVSKLLIELVAE